MGQATRWDGSHRKDEELVAHLRDNGWIIIPLCPEMLGGLPVPRPAANLVALNRDVDHDSNVPGAYENYRAFSYDPATKTYEEHTEEFFIGADHFVQIALMLEQLLSLGAIQKFEVYLKEGSPSCGVRRIYKLTQEHVDHNMEPQPKKVEGMGITTALLQEKLPHLRLKAL